MPVFKAFKDTFTMSLGVNLHKARIEEMIMSTFERMNEAFDITLDNTLTNIEKRATQMNQMYKGPNYKWNFIFIIYYIINFYNSFLLTSRMQILIIKVIVRKLFFTSRNILGISVSSKAISNVTLLLLSPRPIFVSNFLFKLTKSHQFVVMLDTFTSGDLLDQFRN